MPKKARPDLLARLGPRPSEVASPRRSLRLQGLSLADDDAQVAWLEREFLGWGWGEGILGNRLTVLWDDFPWSRNNESLPTPWPWALNPLVTQNIRKRKFHVLSCMRLNLKAQF